MKKTILIIATLLFALNLSIAQNSNPEFNTRHKNIYVEFLGSSLIAGINFDMRLNKGRRDGIGFRAGIGGLSVSAKTSGGKNADATVLVFPMEINHLIGKNRSSFITGIGILPMYANISADINISGNKFNDIKGIGFGGTYLAIGYRFQPRKNGFMFQINWNPVLSAGKLSPSWFGISLGYGFK